MSDEAKAEEYQQVAALLCLDIDLLAEAIDENTSREDLLWWLNDLVEKKNDMISNTASRESRYTASAMLFSLSATPPRDVDTTGGE